MAPLKNILADSGFEKTANSRDSFGEKESDALNI